VTTPGGESTETPCESGWRYCGMPRVGSAASKALVATVTGIEPSTGSNGNGRESLSDHSSPDPPGSGVAA
jgi:hypothetical protein